MWKSLELGLRHYCNKNALSEARLQRWQVFVLDTEEMQTLYSDTELICKSPVPQKKDSMMTEEMQGISTESFRKAAKAAREAKALHRSIMMSYEYDGSMDDVIRQMLEDRLITITAELGHPDVADIPL